VKIQIAERLQLAWLALRGAPATAEQVLAAIHRFGADPRRCLGMSPVLVPAARAMTAAQVRAAIARLVGMGLAWRTNPDAGPARYELTDPMYRNARELRLLLARADADRMPVLEVPFELPGLRALKLDVCRYVVDAGGARRWLEAHAPEPRA
jgi:hypothetical protein